MPQCALGRASGTLISLLPVGVIAFLYLFNPTFIMPLFEDPCGWIMVGIAGAGILVGSLIIRKIVDIDI